MTRHGYNDNTAYRCPRCGEKQLYVRSGAYHDIVARRDSVGYAYDSNVLHRPYVLRCYGCGHSWRFAVKKWPGIIKFLEGEHRKFAGKKRRPPKQT